MLQVLLICDGNRNRHRNIYGPSHHVSSKPLSLSPEVAVISMAPNEHLLDNFSACSETRTLAGQLLREAKVKTAAGSGHEIGKLSTGLPAVCILIASER